MAVLDANIDGLSDAAGRALLSLAYLEGLQALQVEPATVAAARSRLKDVAADPIVLAAAASAYFRTPHSLAAASFVQEAHYLAYVRADLADRAKRFGGRSRS